MQPGPLWTNLGGWRTLSHGGEPNAAFAFVGTAEGQKTKQDTCSVLIVSYTMFLLGRETKEQATRQLYCLLKCRWVNIGLDFKIFK